MKAMILAAGLGSRLRPLTLERPKPGVPFGLRPLICHALDTVCELGVHTIVVNTHHLGDQLPRLVSPHISLPVQYVHEEELLGTGGAIRNARELLAGDEPIVVMNSDIVYRPKLRRALDLHQSSGALATMVLRPDPQAIKFGSVEIDDAGRVRRLLGKPERDGEFRTFMFTGVHILSPSVFDDLPTNGCIIRHSYRRWIDQDDVVCGVVDESPWADVGTIARYFDTHMQLTQNGSLIAHDARIDDGATIDSCVIGSRSQIGPHVLRRCVIWPGARVDRDLENCILTPRTIVRP